MSILFPVTPEEAYVLVYCCSCYLDNENDKGQEGIGSALMDEVGKVVLQCANQSLPPSAMHLEGVCKTPQASVVEQAK